YGESMALFKELGSPPDVARLLHNLGYVEHHEGDYRRARELFTQSLLIFREQANKRGVAECLAGLATLTVAQGGPDAVKGARLLSVVEAWFEASSAVMWPADRIEYEHNLASVRVQLGINAFNKAWEEGHNMKIEH